MVVSGGSLAIFHLDETGLGKRNGGGFDGRHQWLYALDSRGAITTSQQSCDPYNTINSREPLTGAVDELEVVVVVVVVALVVVKKKKVKVFRRSKGGFSVFLGVPFSASHVTQYVAQRGLASKSVYWRK